MSQYIEDPNNPGQYLEFPDDMSDEEIQKTLEPQSNVPDVPIQPVPGTPQVPHGSEPLLYPKIPSTPRDPNEVRAFNPDAAIQSTSDMLRGMGNAVTFGGTDYLRSLLGGQPVADVQKESAEARGRLAPEVALGTELAGGSLLPVGEALAVANKAKSVIPSMKAAQSAMKPQPKVITELIDSINNRAATESTSKAQIIREEAKNFLTTNKSILQDSEVKSLNELIQGGGGPVRKTVEKIASKKPTLGVDPTSIFNLGGLPIIGGAASGSSGIATAKMLLGARIGAGILGKSAVAGAKGASKVLDKKDIGKLKKLFNK